MTLKSIEAGLNRAFRTIPCLMKSKRGIATPKKDMNIICARLRIAEALAKELRNGKAHH